MRTPGRRSRTRSWLSPVLAGLLAAGLLVGAPVSAAQAAPEKTFSDFTPVITGSGKPGEVLTVAQPSVSPEPSTYAYSWKVAGSATVRSSTQAFTPTLSDQSKVATVTVTVSKPAAGFTEKSATATKTIVAGPGFTGNLVVGGTITFPATQGGSLSFGQDGCAGTVVPLTNGTTSYVIPATYGGFSVQLTSGGGTGTCVGPIAKKSFDGFTAATYTGDVKGGSTVTAVDPTNVPDGTTFTYVWTIAGQTASTSKSFTIPADRVEKTLTLTITASAVGYDNKSLSTDPVSIASGTFDFTTVTFTGDAKSGSTVTAVNPTGVPEGTTFTYAWSFGEEQVSTDQAYTVPAGRAGQTLTLTITAKAIGYATKSVSTSSDVALGQLGTVTVSIDDTTPTFGDTLTATTTGTDLPEDASYAYQWGALGQPSTGGPGSGGPGSDGPGSGGPVPATCQPIDGATGDTFTVPASLVGQQLCVTVTVSAEGYDDATDTSDFTTAVAAKSFGDVTGVIDDTTPTFGDTLQGSILATDDLPSDVSVIYTWGRKTEAGCDTSDGSEGQSFTVGSGDIGDELCLVVKLSADGYETLTTEAVFTSTVVAATFELSAPVISDTTPTFGDVLTAVLQIAPEDADVTWAWGTFNPLTETCDVTPIVVTGGDETRGLAEADPSSHTVTADEVGTFLCVVATVSAEGFTTDSATSDPTEKVAPAAFTGGVARFNGNLTVGVQATASVTGLDPESDEASYVWSVDGTEVSTSTSYTPTADDEGKGLTVTITSRRAGYADDVKSAVDLVRKGTFTVPAPVIDDTTPVVGQTLTASVDLSGAPEGATATFQWGQPGEGCQPLDSGAGATFVVDAGLEGEQLCVTVTVSAPGYEDATATSVSTDAVTKGAIDAPGVTIDDSTPAVGQTLTANVDLSQLDLVSDASVSYRWGTYTFITEGVYDCTELEDPSATYTVKVSDLDKELCVVATVRADGYISESSSAFTRPVFKGFKEYAAATISDTTPKVGQVLTATVPGVPSGASVAYYWGTIPAGTTTCMPSQTPTASYTPKVADLGKTVCVIGQVTGVEGYEDSSSAPGFTTRVRETAKVTLSDYTIKRGQKFTIYGFDLAPGKKYSIEVYDTKLTGTAGANGRISRTYTYPTAASSKTRKVAVVQTSGGVTTYRKTATLTYTR